MSKTTQNSRFIYVGVVAIVLILCLAIFGDNGLIKVGRLATMRDSIKEQSALLTDENVRLKAETDILQQDLYAIEKLSRSELDLVRENEILYKFTDH